MVKTEALVYDSGNDGGNGYRTKRTLYVEDSTTDERVTEFEHDVRGRVILTKNPTAPHVFDKYDNMGRLIASGRFSAHSGIVVGTDDPTTETGNRMALRQTSFDEMGRAWKTQQHKIDPADGSDDDNARGADLVRRGWPADQAGRQPAHQDDLRRPRPDDALLHPRPGQRLHLRRHGRRDGRHRHGGAADDVRCVHRRRPDGGHDRAFPRRLGRDADHGGARHERRLGRARVHGGEPRGPDPDHGPLVRRPRAQDGHRALRDLRGLGLRPGRPVGPDAVRHGAADHDDLQHRGRGRGGRGSDGDRLAHRVRRGRPAREGDPQLRRLGELRRSERDRRQRHGRLHLHGRAADRADGGPSEREDGPGDAVHPWDDRGHALGVADLIGSPAPGGRLPRQHQLRRR